MLSMLYYWTKLFKKFGIEPNDNESLPINHKVKREDCPKVPNAALKTVFLMEVGSVIFGFTHCRLDIAFAVGCLTRVMHNPSAGHMSQARHLLKYISQEASMIEHWLLAKLLTFHYNMFSGARLR